MKINYIRKDLKRLNNNFGVTEVEAVNVESEYDAGERGSIYTDKIKLHIKSVENKIYEFILNPAQYVYVINEMRKLAPGAKYILNVNNIMQKNKAKKADNNFNIQYNH